MMAVLPFEFAWRSVQYLVHIDIFCYEVEMKSKIVTMNVIDAQNTMTQ
eukprot:COSAG01_NODE_3603_length_5885_cov_6.630315_2_plen_48_part_00